MRIGAVAGHDIVRDKHAHEVDRRASLAIAPTGHIGGLLLLLLL